MPKGALGKPVEGVDLAVISPETGEECPPAEFDAEGRLLNAGAAIGEIVNRSGRGSFEGYYERADAEQERLRQGWYWTGDLGYVDADGFFYFAGRTGDWLRVDSENFAAGPVEAIISRHPDLAVAAVYPVPDTASGAGDQVMVALETVPGTAFDPDAFAAWLTEQPDLGPKWLPRYVRVSPSLPQTATGKVTKVGLRAEAWATDDPVWWRPLDSSDIRFTLLTDDDRAALAAGLAENGRPPVGDPVDVAACSTRLDRRDGQRLRRHRSTPVRSPTRTSPGSSGGGTSPRRSSSRHTWTAVMPMPRGPRTSGSHESPTKTTSAGSTPSAWSDAS